MDYNIHMNIQMTKYSGFTLIELMVTIAVVGILALAAGPELSTFLARNKLTTQTNNLVGSLNIARSEAAKRATRVTVCIGNTAQNACNGASTSWENGWIAFVDDAAAGTVGVIDAGETILNVNNDVTGDTTIRSTIYTSKISYRGDGSASSDGSNNASGTFRVCNSSEGDSKAKAINVMGSGIVSQAKDTDSDNIVNNYLGNSIVCP